MKPDNLASLLAMPRQMGYEVKEGKDPSLKDSGQKRFVRLSSPGNGYTADDHTTAVVSSEPDSKAGELKLLIDVQRKLRGESKDYLIESPKWPSGNCLLSLLFQLRG